MRGTLILATLGMMISTMAVADDGSCGDYRPSAKTELKMCVDLAKGATSRDAKVARKLIENGNASWSASGQNGDCRMSVATRGVIGGNSHAVRATCTVSDPQALRACVEKAQYGTDVTRCGLQHLKK